MKNESTKGLREGAMAVALTAVLMLFTRFVPLFSIVGTFVCGIPLAVFAARNNLKTVIITLFAVFAIAVIIDGNPISAATLILMSCVPGGIAGYMLGKKQPFFTTLFATSAVVCVGWIFELVVLKLVVGNGIDEMFVQAMEQAKTMMSGIIGNMDDSIKGELEVSPEEFMSSLIAQTIKMMRLYIPSFIILSSLLTGYIIVRLSGFLANRTKLANVKVVEFSQIKAPRSMSNVAIILYLIYIFTGEKSAVFPLIANAVFIIYMILGICGLSVVDYKFKAKIKAAAARFAIYILVFMLGGIFVSIISTVLIFIGIMDAGRDFRQIGNYGV